MRVTIKRCLLLMLCVLGAQPTVYGCICPSDILPCEEYQASDAVFVGTVINVSPGSWKPDGLTTLLVKWQVGKVYKGELAKVVTFSQIEFNSCSPKFRLGETWLVYASQRSEAAVEPRSCSRSAQLSAATAAADIAYLEKLTAQADLTRLQGSLRYDEIVVFLQALSPTGPMPSLAGIKVQLRLGESLFEAVTDENGMYEILGLMPGDYQVTPQLPATLKQARERPPVTVKIQQRACSCLDFVLHPQSQ